jgi:glycosyltransferase involved in cell wall biosynthesis
VTASSAAASQRSGEAGRPTPYVDYPQHIAFFVHGLAGSGAQWRMINLANDFAARGHQVDLVVMRSRGPLRDAIARDIRVVHLDPAWTKLWWARGLRGRLWLPGLIGLVKYLRHQQPLCLLSTSYAANVIAIWARELSGAPTRLVIRVSNHLSHSATHEPSRLRRLSLWAAKYFYRFADEIVAVSQGVADDVAAITGLPADRIRAIDNPVLTADAEEKARMPLEHPWFAPGSPPVVLSVGRLVRQKDFATLIRAFAYVRATRPVRLMILGEGRQRHALDRLARELGVADDVALPGYVMNPFPHMARAGVFVLSSLWEGLPGGLVEAMSCGCPVVSTDCPAGPAELLAGGACGKLTPVGNARALAEAIGSVLADPPDPVHLRSRAATFSVARASEDYLRVLLRA